MLSQAERIKIREAKKKKKKKKKHNAQWSPHLAWQQSFDMWRYYMFINISIVEFNFACQMRLESLVISPQILFE